MGHGAVEDAVAGIIEEPILIHAAQMMHGCGIEAVHGFIVGVAFLLALRLLLFWALRQLVLTAVFFYLVVHSLPGL